MTAVTVSPVAYTFGAPYLPGLEQALRAVQDTDTALLGVVHPSRPGGALSTARQLTREAVRGIHRFLTAGRSSR